MTLRHRHHVGRSEIVRRACHSRDAYMHRYFFHFHDGEVQEDREGFELPSDDEAWRQGVTMGAQILRDYGGDLQNGEEYRLECLAEDGRGVFTVRFSAQRHLQQG